MVDPQSLETRLDVAFVMLVLGESPTAGSELHERLRECGIASTPARLDHALRRLEAQGFLDSEWEEAMTGPDERVYGLTAAGRRELDRTATAIATLGDRVGAFLREYGIREP